jgi:hypothetical protein
MRKVVLDSRANKRLSVACIFVAMGLMIWVLWDKRGLPASEWCFGVACGLAFARRLMSDEL